MAHKNSFSIQEALRFGWNTFKANWQFLLTVFVIILLITMIPSWLNDWSAKNLPAIRFLISIVGWIAQLVVSIGIIVISLKFIDGKKPKIEDVYSHYPLLLNYFLGSILYFLILLGGLILLIIPGIYFAIKYQFFSYFIIDKKMKPIEAIKASGKITEGVKWKLLGLGVVFALVTILGMLTFGIGLLVSWPVVSLAQAYVYRKLSHKE